MNTGRSTSVVRPACTMEVIIFFVTHLVTALRKTELHIKQEDTFARFTRQKNLKRGGNKLVDKIHRADVDFSTQLEKAMKLRDIGPTKLARKSGVQRSQICRYLTAEIAPTTNNIRRLSIALNVTTDYLLGLAKTDER